MSLLFQSHSRFYKEWLTVCSAPRCAVRVRLRCPATRPLTLLADPAAAAAADAYDLCFIGVVVVDVETTEVVAGAAAVVEESALLIARTGNLGGMIFGVYLRRERLTTNTRSNAGISILLRMPSNVS